MKHTLINSIEYVESLVVADVISSIFANFPSLKGDLSVKHSVEDHVAAIFNEILEAHSYQIEEEFGGYYDEDELDAEECCESELDLDEIPIRENVHIPEDYSTKLKDL